MSKSRCWQFSEAVKWPVHERHFLMLPQTFIWFLEKMHYLQIENVVFIYLLTYLSFKKKIFV